MWLAHIWLIQKIQGWTVRQVCIWGTLTQLRLWLFPLILLCAWAPLRVFPCLTLLSSHMVLFSWQQLVAKETTVKPKVSASLPCRETQPLLISPSTAASWHDLRKLCQTLSKELSLPALGPSPGAEDSWKKGARLGWESQDHRTRVAPRYHITPALPWFFNVNFSLKCHIY